MRDGESLYAEASRAGVEEAECNECAMTRRLAPLRGGDGWHWGFAIRYAIGSTCGFVVSKTSACSRQRVYRRPSCPDSDRPIGDRDGLHPGEAVPRHMEHARPKWPSGEAIRPGRATDAAGTRPGMDAYPAQGQETAASARNRPHLDVSAGQPLWRHPRECKESLRTSPQSRRSDESHFLEVQPVAPAIFPPQYPRAPSALTTCRGCMHRDCPAAGRASRQLDGFPRSQCSGGGSRR